MEQESTPKCFADIDRVMPFEEETGLRGPNHECLPCPVLRDCLRQAVQTTRGREERSQRLEETSGGGLLGRLRMWHERKMLERK
jgi:hypothetical protein